MVKTNFLKLSVDAYEQCPISFCWKMKVKAILSRSHREVVSSVCEVKLNYFLDVIISRKA